MFWWNFLRKAASMKSNEVDVQNKHTQKQTTIIVIVRMFSFAFFPFISFSRSFFSSHFLSNVLFTALLCLAIKYDENNNNNNRKKNTYRAHMKLTIRNLQYGDFGNYRCISKNSLGETEGSIRVYGKRFTILVCAQYLERWWLFVRSKKEEKKT